MSISKYRVPASKLRWHCDPEQFDFKSTEELAPLKEFVGQTRAIQAIDFGLSINHDGYNIYVAGLTGMGKTSAVKTHIDKLLKEKNAQHTLKIPNDWCYIYNFVNADKPRALQLPPGGGKKLRDNVSSLLQRIKEDMAKAYSNKEYVEAKKKTVEESQTQQQRLLEELKSESEQLGFLFQITPSGPALVVLANGKPVSQEEYMELAEPVRKEMEAQRTVMLKKIQETYEHAGEMQKELAEKLKNADKVVAELTVAHLFDSLVREYKKWPEAEQYLADLNQYTLDNADIFKEKDEPGETLSGLPVNLLMRGNDPFLPFRINVFVDNSGASGPPVIVESHPIYTNLVGKIERRFLMGGYISDHTMIKPGSIHSANGGYLLLNAPDLLVNPGVWSALKRAIKTREIQIEDPLEQIGMASPQGMKPQPIPIDIKVVLIGDTTLYQLLAMHDEDFWEIFKVKAEFDSEVDRSPEIMRHYAEFISSCCGKYQMHHFNRSAVARIIEQASRMVADQEKLSSRFALIRELVQEADY